MVPGDLRTAQTCAKLIYFAVFSFNGLRNRGLSIKGQDERFVLLTNLLTFPRKQPKLATHSLLSSSVNKIIYFTFF